MTERVIICRCGQWNLVKGDELAKGFFECGGCRGQLSTSGLPLPRKRRRWALLLVVLLIAAGLCGVYVFVPDARQTVSVLVSSADALSSGLLESLRVRVEAPVLQPVAIKTGTIRGNSTGRSVATFAVEADDSNYALRIIDKKTNTETLMVFIASKQMFETKLPLGTYRILGAKGDTWYGEQHLFGPSTSYFAIRKSRSIGPAGGTPLPGDDEFVLSQTGNTINGIRIMLRTSVDGTIATQPMSPGEFRQQ